MLMPLLSGLGACFLSPHDYIPSAPVPLLVLD